MRYIHDVTICIILSLTLSACGKDPVSQSPASSPPAESVKSLFSKMTCLPEINGYLLCGTDQGITQTRPSACAVTISTSGIGVPLAIGSRTVGPYVNVNDVWDCGVIDGMRCVLVEYANGYQDAHCDVWELP